MTNIDLRGIRRSRIQQLINERFGGRQIDFSIAAKRNSTQVNQWLTGHRNPNGDTCRKVEDALKLSRDWLDQPYATPAEADTTENIGIRTPSNLPDVDAAVETIAQALEKMTEAERAAVMGKIGKLADAYDSAAVKKSIVQALRLAGSAQEAVKAFAQSGKKAA
ncbi:MAG: hypothetical protein K9K35_11670 [Rhodoferax sp.]|nr:hypothetical protein [Rhodoferax sp.]